MCNEKCISCKLRQDEDEISTSPITETRINKDKGSRKMSKIRFILFLGEWCFKLKTKSYF
jgi:hypothetical protein